MKLGNAFKPTLVSAIHVLHQNVIEAQSLDMQQILKCKFCKNIITNMPLLQTGDLYFQDKCSEKSFAHGHENATTSQNLVILF